MSGSWPMASCWRRRATTIPFESRVILRHEVEAADELMLSSATKEILPITQYDGRPVGSGKPGPVYAKLRAAYDTVIERLLQG